jgi:hypothetical protein
LKGFSRSSTKSKDEKNEQYNLLLRMVHQGRSLAALLPIVAAVCIAYLVIDLAMPVLPLHVHQPCSTSCARPGRITREKAAFAIAVVPSTER